MTLGTGAFILAQAGSTAPEPPPGVLASCAWRRCGKTSYALEGFVPAAGAALDAFAALGVLPPAAELDDLLSAAGPEDGSVACVPAFQGLGTPAWDASTARRSSVSRARRRAPRSPARLSTAYFTRSQTRSRRSAQRCRLQTVLLDGGMSRSDWVVQRLADLAEIRVARAARGEATAIGAAMMAGLASGFWSSVEDLPEVETDRIAEPSLASSERGARRERWAAAVGLARRWERRG